MSSNQIFGKISDIFGYLNIFRFFFRVLHIFWAGPELNPTQNQTESKLTNSSYPIRSNYIRSDGTRTDNFFLPIRSKYVRPE